MLGRIKSRMSGMQMIALGFVVLISIGTLLLMLPISSRSGEWTPFLTSLFTATSASCVTGLVVVDTFTHWSLFGQLIILCMIQIGGLGFITFGVAISLLLHQKIGLKQRGLIQESYNTLEISGVVKLTKRVVFGALLFESAGAVLLTIRFVQQMDFPHALYYGIFHSISAFCNAGFDLMGAYTPFSSLTAYYNDPLIVLTISALIIIGGIGFFVWSDIREHGLHFKHYALHTKMVLSATAVLLVLSTLLFYLLERNYLFADMDGQGQFLSSLFCAVTPRTAGFNTTDVGALRDSSKLLTCILMFIGGAPGSTAGGIKVTTIFVLLLYVRSTLMRTSGTNVFKRRLENSVIEKAAVVMFLNLCLGLCAILAISSMTPFALTDITLEVFSAIGTVGMSAGLTTQLNTGAHLILILLMYLGRVGSLSFALAFTDKKKIAHVLQPVEKINVG